MQEIGKFDVKVNDIPNGLEKHIAFKISYNLGFIDSMQFINFSLDALVKNLSDNYFKYLSKKFSGDLLELVKGAYSYEYMDSFETFFDEKLPDRRKFFSSLKDELLVKKTIHILLIFVWNTFKMNTMGDYHDLYLKTDVLLLADVFEKFISTCLKYYGLDPCHYFSSPGLSWDAMLKMTGIELELISDIAMHLFIEKGMRRSISYIAERFSKANSIYIKSYDVNKPSKFIMYLDANNLNGWAMSQYLLYSIFKWLNQKEIDKFDVKSTECNSIKKKIFQQDTY